MRRRSAQRRSQQLQERVDVRFSQDRRQRISDPRVASAARLIARRVPCSGRVRTRAHGPGRLQQREPARHSGKITDPSDRRYRRASRKLDATRERTAERLFRGCERVARRNGLPTRTIVYAPQARLPRKSRTRTIHPASRCPLSASPVIFDVTPCRRRSHQLRALNEKLAGPPT
jgi:hypothetical protein